MEKFLEDNSAHGLKDFPFCCAVGLIWGLGPDYDEGDLPSDSSIDSFRAYIRKAILQEFSRVLVVIHTGQEIYPLFEKSPYWQEIQTWVNPNSDNLLRMYIADIGPESEYLDHLGYAHMWEDLSDYE